jgi:hypothetical protein
VSTLAATLHHRADRAATALEQMEGHMDTARRHYLLGKAVALREVALYVEQLERKDTP